MERRLRLPQTLSEFVAHWWTGTQTELAARLGISEGHLSHLIAGNRQPSLTLAVRISELTGIPEKALMQPRPTTDSPAEVA
jgi:transcriptional regulator with XRE-family HTH domain